MAAVPVGSSRGLASARTVRPLPLFGSSITNGLRYLVVYRAERKYIDHGAELKAIGIWWVVMSSIINAASTVNTDATVNVSLFS